MEASPWWEYAQPHSNIRDGKVNEALFEAKLGEAIQDRGPDEYRLAELFFRKTFFTAGLRGLLHDVLQTLSGRRTANAVVNLKTSFGGGKTHTELAVYHLLVHPEESMGNPQIRELVAAAGLDAPPACRVAVLPGTNLSPTGRTTDDGLEIRTLWGEMAYRLGGPEAFALVANEDALLVSPGEDKLREVLQQVGPSLVLLDETLHYVDKASSILGGNGDDLAKQTVAFLRELTGVVDSLDNSMVVVSLTASRMDQLSSNAQDWLERMEHHVNRLAHACTPIEGTEIHEVVRNRLFDGVDEKAAAATANRYHQLYASLNGLPGQYVDVAYRELIRRSYPFHPELITVIYERWGAKPGFQLTRGTLRFLALVLQDLWGKRETVTPDLIQMGHVPAGESGVRAMIRDIAGDPQWDTVIGSDIAAAGSKEVQPAKAQLIDRERKDDLRLAESLATTILLYSVGGGENPEATRHEIRLACARRDVNEATWDDLLEKFHRRLFYLYYDDAKYKFRKEPNVTSLHHTYRVNIKESGEIDAQINKTLQERALGRNSPSQGFADIYYLPLEQLDRDSEELKLLVLGFDQPVIMGKPTENTLDAAMAILERHGQVLRQYRNTIVFCAPEQELVDRAREVTADFLSWRKIQLNTTDWDRIGGSQQLLVKSQMEETEGAALQAITSAYNHALIPVQSKVTAGLSLEPVPLGTYGPGKYVAPMVWDSLTAKIAQSQWLLRELTAETFIERYGPMAWPESERSVTTAQLWQRFTTQVGLPILARRETLLEMLRQGAYEGLLAIGLLLDEQSPRDQRDSYVQLHFKEMLLSNVPLIGERWVVLRPDLYRDVAEQPDRVTVEQVVTAFEQLGGESGAVNPAGLYRYVKSQHKHGIDEVSYREAVEQAVKENHLGYRADGKTLSEVAVDDPEALAGEFFKDTRVKPAARDGRTIVIKGTILPAKELADLFTKVVRPLDSQKPASLTMELVLTAHFDTDPGSGLDASLDDAFDKDAFPGLRREDSKGSN